MMIQKQQYGQLLRWPKATWVCSPKVRYRCLNWTSFVINHFFLTQNVWSILLPEMQPLWERLAPPQEILHQSSKCQTIDLLQPKKKVNVQRICHIKKDVSVTKFYAHKRYIWCTNFRVLFIVHNFYINLLKQDFTYSLKIALKICSNISQ